MANLTGITDSALITIEDPVYEAAKTTLDESKNNSITCTVLFQDLFEKLKNEVDEKRISNPDKTNFYANVFNQTAQLYQSIGQPNFHYQLDKYITLANTVEGNPSCGRIMLGLLFCIGGVTLLTASGFALLATKGGSAYLSAYLAKIGIRCSQHGLGMMSAAGGVAAILVSVGLMSRHGPAKKMQGIASEADREDKQIKRAIAQ